MRMRSLPVVITSCLVTALCAGPAYADTYIEGRPGTPQTSCSGSYENGESTCTFSAIGGRTFVVGGFGAGAFVITLEAPSELPGGPTRILAKCDGIGFQGCIGGRGYDAPPVPAGTPLTCRVVGLGTGTFECSSFDVD
jgi:hypothetical protein